MNLRSEIVIEIIKNNNTYRFSVPVGVPFGDCHAVALEAAQVIVDMAKQYEEQMKEQEKQKTSEQEPAVKGEEDGQS